MKKTVTALSYNARFYAGDAVPWADVYFAYKIRRKVRRLAPCIMGRLDVAANALAHLEVEKDLGPDVDPDSDWRREGRFIIHCEIGLPAGRIVMDNGSPVDGTPDVTDRIPNVAVPNDLVTEKDVLHVARHMLLVYEGIEADVRLRWKKTVTIVHPM